MYTHIVREIIQKEFDNLKQENANESGKPSRMGMQISFRLSTFYSVKLKTEFDEAQFSAIASDYYPKLEILLHGDYNYIGVYTRCYDIHGRSVSKANAQWEVWAYHDICWRDGLDKVLQVYEPHITCLDDLFHQKWYKILELDEETISTLKIVRKARYS